MAFAVAMTESPRTMNRPSLLCLGCVVVMFASCKKEEAAPVTPAPTTVAPKVNAPPPNAAAGFGGTYTIASASNPGGGGGYTGTVDIAAGAVHTVKWSLPNSPPYSGVGLITDGALGIGWGLGANYGVVVYKVNGGTLEGRWATAVTGNFVGTETISGPEGLNGTYKITAATTPTGGGSYSGTVDITPNGETYNVKWTLEGGASYGGVGMKRGNTLIVGWGVGEKSAGTVVYELKDGKLDGKWAQPGGPQLGTEVLEKK